MELDAGVPLGRSVVRLASEDAWAILGCAASFALTVGLFVRALAHARRAKLGGAIAAAVALPLVLVFAAFAGSARHDRLNLREAVLVTSTARPAPAPHAAAANVSPLPEGARVEIVGAESGAVKVQFGTTEGWIPAASVRALAEGA
jgi:hypothetical protein